MKNLSVTFVLTLFVAISGHNNVQGQSHQRISKLNLLVSNVCEYVGQLVICNGSDSLQATPSYGSAGNIFGPSYTHYDSLPAFDKVRIFDMSDDGPQIYVQKLLVMGDENKLITFLTSFLNWGVIDPIIIPRDTLLVDSIASAKIDYNKIVVIRSTPFTDNFIVFDTTSSIPVFSTNLGMTPLLLDVTYSYTAVVGLNSTNEIQLKIFNTNSWALVQDTLFGSLASQPISLLLANQDLLYLVSQPGDTAVYMTKFDGFTNVISSVSMYSSSGTHAFDWDGNYFHFQPESDSSGNNYDTKIIKYDPYNLQQMGVYNTNRRFHKIIFAGDGGFAYYDFMHCVEESVLNNKVIIYLYFNYSEVDSFTTDHQVDFIESDFRCPVSLEEYDDTQVSLSVFPNPTGNSITIRAKGLICGREYKMDLVDLNGKSWFDKIIHAKMSLEVPLDHLSAGIYILRIHTVHGMVTEKIVKQ